MRTARFICGCFNSVFCVVILTAILLCLATIWFRPVTNLLEFDFLSLCLETRALRNTYLDHLKVLRLREKGKKIFKILLISTVFFIN